MTLSVTDIAENASPLRGLLPLWVGIGVYALFLLTGNRLLIDPDTMWQVTVGQWIIDHRAVPETDVYSFTMRGQPWISTQWLAQVALCESLCNSRLERAGGARGRRDRGDLRAARQISQPASDRKHDAGIRCCGAGADDAAPAGAAARAGDAGHGGVDRRADRGCRSARRAVVLAAAVDGAMGQSAWRLCARPRAGRPHRARCRVGTPMSHRADRWCCDGRPSASPRWRRAAARPMAGIRCWRLEKFSRSAPRCR